MPMPKQPNPNRMGRVTLPKAITGSAKPKLMEEKKDTKKDRGFI